MNYKLCEVLDLSIKSYENTNQLHI